MPRPEVPRDNAAGGDSLSDDSRPPSSFLFLFILYLYPAPSRNARPPPHPNRRLRRQRTRTRKKIFGVSVGSLALRPL
jgi:hypothetical protein